LKRDVKIGLYAGEHVDPIGISEKVGLFQDSIVPDFPYSSDKKFTF
jgi:hypothetical protein